MNCRYFMQENDKHSLPHINRLDFPSLQSFLFFFSEHLSPAVSSVVGSSEIRQTTRMGQRLFGIKSQYTDHMRRIHNYSPFSVPCSRLWEDWWEDWWVRAISGNGSWLNTPRKCMPSRTRWASVWMDWVNFRGNKVLTDLGIVPWSTTSYHRTLYEFLSLSCAKWFGMFFLIFYLNSVSPVVT